MSQAIIESISVQAKNIDPIGATIKFSIGEVKIYIDGNGDENVVTECDDEADCVISTDLETLQKLQSGDLNAMMAVMSGKIKVAGDIGLAMKLQSLI